MELCHFSLRSFIVSFLILQVLENRGPLLVLGLDVRYVYFRLPSQDSRTVLKAGSAMFGTNLRGKDPIEAKVNMVQPSNGCTDILNGDDVRDKIALVDRGACMFIEKARFIQRTGAVAAIVLDNNPFISSETVPVFIMHHGYQDDDITIPMVFLYFEEARTLINATRQDLDIVVGVADAVPIPVETTTAEPVPTTITEAIETTTAEPVPTTITEAIPGAIDGGWTDWSNWTQCPVTCSFGYQKRYRSCRNPEPSGEGRTCEGSSEDRKLCDDLIECPVNGGWSNWDPWRQCSTTCGMGIRRRNRTCTNPAPQGGGLDCVGLPQDVNLCFIRECPVVFFTVSERSSLKESVFVTTPAVTKQTNPDRTSSEKEAQEQKTKRSDEKAGGTSQLSPTYIALIAIGALIVIAVSAASCYFFCPSAGQTVYAKMTNTV